MPKWKLNGWKSSNRKPVKNKQLWHRLDCLLQGKKIGWFWIKSHTGHVYNEEADRIAKSQADIYREESQMNVKKRKAVEVSQGEPSKKKQ
jgi:ribonuclease HI